MADKARLFLLQPVRFYKPGDAQDNEGGENRYFTNQEHIVSRCINFEMLTYPHLKNKAYELSNQ